MPDPKVEIAFADDPLEPAPTFVEIPWDQVRRIEFSYGRSWEFDRGQTGTFMILLDNSEGHLNPDNEAGDYWPNVIPTRRVRVTCEWDGDTYSLFEMFSMGWPQDYPASGMDSVVQLAGADWFYPLNMLKFAGASTTLATTITTTPEAGTVETIDVASTALPLPQAFPFTIQVGPSGEIEKMTVTGSPGAGQWTVERGADGTTTAIHTAGDTVRSEAVRFAAELTGTRINNVLDMLGLDALDRDIDDGNTMLAASDDLAGQSILDHLQFVQEVEHGGRLFASKTGTITFRERHWQFLDEVNPRATFGDQGTVDESRMLLEDGTGFLELEDGTGFLGLEGSLVTSEIAYLAVGNNRVDQDESKLYNHVRLTIGDGSIVERTDQDSIDGHFERVFEKQWPFQSAVAARSAAAYMLGTLKQAKTRVPAVTVDPAGHDPDVAWPVVLGAEIGYRYGYRMHPVDGTEMDTDVLVEKITHVITPGDWRVTFEFSKAGPRVYWRLGTAGFSELGSTTRLGD